MSSRPDTSCAQCNDAAPADPAGVLSHAPRKSAHSDVGDPNDRGADRVGLGQVDLRADAPVVMALWVVEDLPHAPVLGVLVDDEKRRTAGCWPPPQVGVLGEVVAHDLPPSLGIPAGGGVELP